MSGKTTITPEQVQAYIQETLEKHFADTPVDYASQVKASRDGERINVQIPVDEATYYYLMWRRTMDELAERCEAMDAVVGAARGVAVAWKANDEHGTGINKIRLNQATYDLVLAMDAMEPGGEP